MKNNTAFDSGNQQKSYFEHIMEVIKTRSIIPVGQDKKALIPWREFQSRRPSLDEVKAWWTRWPDANLAIVTGEISGLTVVDCDSEAARRRLDAYIKDINPPEVKTPGGYHLYFHYAPGLKNRARYLPETDVRTDGGYVVAPPSVNADGVAYEWIKPIDGPLPPMPDALKALLLAGENTKHEHHERPRTNTGTGSPYGQKALADECKKVADASPGERNNQLNESALKLGRLVGGGVLSYGDVETALLAAALSCGLNESEAVATIKSGMAKGIQEPRTPPNNGPHASGQRERTAPPADDEWQEPEPLPDSLRPVEKFHDALLPAALRPWGADIADRMQCPKDFVGVGAMVALGSVIGRRVCIRPKRFDDWSVIPNLWGVMIGPPSAMKSPAGDEVMKPIKRLEIEAKEVFEAEQKEYDKALVMAKAQSEIDKERVKKELKGGKSFGEISFNSIDENAGDAPVRPRFYTSDTTIEKLGVVMMENPGGVLSYRDEQYGWFKNLSREDRANDRAFYLETWSGTGRYTFDRIGRGTVDVENLCLSIWGGIQPGRMASVIRGAISGGADDDGMAPRFGMMVYPDIQREFKIVDRWPDKAAKLMAFDVFKRLAALPVPGPGQDIPVMRFDDDAQELFFAWWVELETELRGGELHPALEKHFTKYRKLIPALALICHLAGDDDVEIPRPGHEDTHGIVPLPALQMALAWYEYLRSHAERIYGMAMAGNMAAAKVLLQKLKSGKLKSPFTKRDIKHKGWAGLSEDEDIRLALNTLVEYGLVVRVAPPVAPSGGRPSVLYYLNPKAVA